MPTENELEELTNDFLDDMIKSKGVGINGGTAEQVKIMGSLAERSGTDRVSGENVLQG